MLAVESEMTIANSSIVGDISCHSSLSRMNCSYTTSPSASNELSAQLARSDGAIEVLPVILLAMRRQAAARTW